jgi:hypothetical protein
VVAIDSGVLVAVIGEAVGWAVKVWATMVPSKSPGGVGAVDGAFVLAKRQPERVNRLKVRARAIFFMSAFLLWESTPKAMSRRGRED